jgi:hypothetical protein
MVVWFLFCVVVDHGAGPIFFVGVRHSEIFLSAQQYHWVRFPPERTPVSGLFRSREQGCCLGFGFHRRYQVFIRCLFYCLYQIGDRIYPSRFQHRCLLLELFPCSSNRWCCGWFRLAASCSCAWPHWSSSFRDRRLASSSRISCPQWICRCRWSSPEDFPLNCLRSSGSICHRHLAPGLGFRQEVALAGLPLLILFVVCKLRVFSF